MRAGNATALAASSCGAAAPLRSAPPGDAASAVANVLATTGFLTTTAAAASAMPLTSPRGVGKFRSLRAQPHRSTPCFSPRTVQRTRTTSEGPGAGRGNLLAGRVRPGGDGAEYAVFGLKAWHDYPPAPWCRDREDLRAASRGPRTGGELFREIEAEDGWVHVVLP